MRSQSATKEIPGGDSGESSNHFLDPEAHSAIEDDGRDDDLRDPWLEPYVQQTSRFDESVAERLMSDAVPKIEAVPLGSDQPIAERPVKTTILDAEGPDRRDWTTLGPDPQKRTEKLRVLASSQRAPTKSLPNRLRRHLAALLLELG